MKLPHRSVEQKEVIKSISKGNNVIVDSVAGSGKTTCNLHIAKYFPYMKVLLLTYNAKLKLETRVKVSKLRLKNIETQSYHSFCVKHYNDECFTDTIMNTIVLRNVLPYDQIDYDIIIIDEAQDISKLYYQLVCKIYKDNIKQAKLCIIGDKFQSIFQFNGSDERYIIFGKDLFNFNDSPWITCNLSTSFRITAEMSTFINDCMLHEDRIISTKISNHKPRYLICDTFGNHVFQELVYYLDLGYGADDIFILAPSIKKSSVSNNASKFPQDNPITVLENRIKLELSTINVYAPDECEKIDDDVIKGKLVFATFHQSKGLERKVVIVFGFDNSYFDYYKKNCDTRICPNELYVAVTRGIERITLVHNKSSTYLPFLCEAKLESTCDIICKSKIAPRKKTIQDKTSSEPEPTNTSPTQLLSHIPQSVLDKCFASLTFDIIRPSSRKIYISPKTSKDICCESVSELNGIAIPNYYGMLLKGELSIFNTLIKIRFPYTDPGNEKNKQIFDRLSNISIDNISSDDFLFIVNCWNCYKSKFLYKMFQIESYNWLPQSVLSDCAERISTSLHITKEAEFEVEYIITVSLCSLEIIITGYVDCIDNCNLYEFKCVTVLNMESYLQLAIYIYLNKKKYEKEKEKEKEMEEEKEKEEETEKEEGTEEGTRTEKEKEKEKEKTIPEKDMRYYLYNILSDELICITNDMVSLTQIMEILIDHKYFHKYKISDESFLFDVYEIRKKWFPEEMLINSLTSLSICNK